MGDDEDSNILSLDVGNLPLGKDFGEDTEWLGLNRCCNFISVGNSYLAILLLLLTIQSKSSCVCLGLNLKLFACCAQVQDLWQLPHPAPV